MIVHSVFDAAANVAITAFGVRPPVTAGAAGEAYLEIANYGSQAQDVRLVITRGAAVVQDAPVPLTAGQVARTTITVPMTGDPRLKAKISAPANALSIDDEAVAWVPGAEPVPVTVVSDQPGPLQQLLQRDPGLRVTFVTTSAYRPGGEAVVIFDRWVPPDAPRHPALFIAPPAAPWLGTAGRRGAPGDLDEDRGTSCPQRRRCVDDRYQARPRLCRYGLEPVAVSERGTPLVAIADESERRVVVLTFALGDSNLPFAPAFPVLIGNALDWLAGPADALGRQPGRLVLPSSTATVTGPDGRPVPIVRFGDHAVTMLARPGFYTIEAGGSRRTIAANVGDAQVSNLTRTSLSNPNSASTALAGAAARPWWLYALSAAFVLLSLEWWTWQRRITV